MDPITLASILVNVAVVTIFVSILMFCLKIKTTKKTPELLGTVGTVKTFDEDGIRALITSSPPSSLNTTRNSHQPNSSKISSLHNTSGPLVVVPPPSAPSPASLGNTSSAGHSPAPSPYYPEHRTPSRAGERKLPEIPRGSDNGSMSELYDTLGPPQPNREASDSETETDGARANHPYARVKKRNPKEHPYATVSHHNRGSANEDVLLAVEDHLVPPPPTVHPPPPPPENAATTHFSGDSQDSSKGYTSISVREPLCHIQPQVASRSAVAASNRQNATYMAVSEASDDMYAAIDDPTYIPAGGISQTNSDTYAVINLPDYDSGSQTYQKLEGAEEEDEDISSPAHTYSKIDKNKKKRASAPPPPLPPPPHHPGPPRPVSFNVDDMYAKVQKSPPPRPDLTPEDTMPVGASAMRSNGRALGSPRNSRVRSGHWDSASEESSRRSQNWDPSNEEVSRRVHRGEVNYSDFETSHFDPKQRSSDHFDPKQRSDRRSGPVQPSPKFHHDPIRVNRNQTDQAVRINRNSAPDKVPAQLITTGEDGGYETVPESASAATRIDPATVCSPPRNEHGYEQVVEYWLRRPPGSVNTQQDGYDFVGEEGGHRIGGEHGYETLPEMERMVGYPSSHRIPAAETEPPYAVLTSQDFGEEESEEEEEGYETIPASERRSMTARKDSNEDDPGYESVRKKESVISYGYEVVASKNVKRRESASSRNAKKDPGYETVKSPREHDYETVAGLNKKQSTATDYGYETVENIKHFERIDESRFAVENVQHFERGDESRFAGPAQMRSMPTTHVEMRRHAAPPPPVVSHHPPAGRSVSLSPKLGVSDPPEPISPSVRMAVRHPASSQQQQQLRRPPRRSSVTVIELRTDDQRSSPGLNIDDEDDDTVNSGSEGAEVNTTIFV